MSFQKQKSLSVALPPGAALRLVSSYNHIKCWVSARTLKILVHIVRWRRGLNGDVVRRLINYCSVLRGSAVRGASCCKDESGIGYSSSTDPLGEDWRRGLI